MKHRLLIYLLLAVLLGTVWIVRNSSGPEVDYTSKVKAAMREVGDRLLREVGDSTSLINPVREVEEGRFIMTFEHPLQMDPSWLVANTYSSFRIAGLPDNYLVQVIQGGEEVAYSYEMNSGVDKTVIPCQGRVLPSNDYTIEARFNGMPVGTDDNPLYYFMIFMGVVIVGEYVGNGKRLKGDQQTDNDYVSIGSFRFYPENYKLIKEAEEIQLSKKETELLSIFVARPNEVIERDELTKRVWEDNGVFVGRSLDTYISKLRKKLQDDDCIKISNVHGVGYKLEVNLS